MKPVTSNKRDCAPSTATTAVAADVILMVAKARQQRHLTPFSQQKVGPLVGTFLSSFFRGSEMKSFSEKVSMAGATISSRFILWKDRH